MRLGMYSNRIGQFQVHRWENISKLNENIDLENVLFSLGDENLCADHQNDSMYVYVLMMDRQNFECGPHNHKITQKLHFREVE